MKPFLRIFANATQTTIVFRYEVAIPDCNGFAIYRLRNGQTEDKAEVLRNQIGYASDQPIAPGADAATRVWRLTSSEKWPIQRFIWTDYLVGPGDRVQYRVVPVIRQAGQNHLAPEHASDWSESVRVGQPTNGAEAYFNRGFVASQFLARRLFKLDPNFAKNKTLAGEIAKEASPIRAFLGGTLAERLTRLLDEIAADPLLTVHAALYELHEPTLIRRLAKIGNRANVILANGPNPKGEDKNPHLLAGEVEWDANWESRRTLKAAGVVVVDRLVQGHQIHNKFLVISRGGVPVRVWTGSTNWTPNGLFTQLNNGLLLSDAGVAEWFRTQWDAIGADNSQMSRAYIEQNDRPRQRPANDTTVWFAPSEKLDGSTADKQLFGDLEAVKHLIDGAKHGILFLMFSPSITRTDSLYDYLLEVKDRNPALLIHGVLNTISKKNLGRDEFKIEFIERGHLKDGDTTTATPKSIASTTAFWQSEQSRPTVAIHSKIIVIDPFGDVPVVITGSHNLGVAASGNNDENMVIIRQNAPLAQAYAVHILAAFDHYNWRYRFANDPNALLNKGLDEGADWMTRFMTADRLHELDFYLPRLPV